MSRLEGRTLVEQTHMHSFLPSREYEIKEINFSSVFEERFISSFLPCICFNAAMQRFFFLNRLQHDCRLRWLARSLPRIEWGALETAPDAEQEAVVGEDPHGLLR